MAAKALYSVVTGDAGVSAIIGTRMHPQRAPQGETLPYIVYSRITASNGSHGVSLDRGALREILFQVNCYAATYSEMDALVDAVRLAVDVTAKTAAAQTWQVCHVVDMRDEWVWDLPGRETGIHGTQMDLSIWFQEPTS